METPEAATMDATSAGDQRDARSDDGASLKTTSVVPEARPPAPLLSEPVRGGSGGAAAEGGEVDDEQVERFYALLANIRALKGLHGGGSSSKRARGASDEPPWRPRFRMEDFQFQEDVADDAGCAKKEERKDGVGPAPPKKQASDEEGAIVEQEKIRRVLGSPRRNPPTC